MAQPALLSRLLYFGFDSHYRPDYIDGGRVLPTGRTVPFDGGAGNVLLEGADTVLLEGPGTVVLDGAGTVLVGGVDEVLKQAS